MSPRQKPSTSAGHRAAVAALAALATCGTVVASSPFMTRAAAASPAPASASAATSHPAPAPSPGLSAAALRACAQREQFINVAGQGQLCAAGPSWVMRLDNGQRMTISPPDSSAALTSLPATAPAAAAPLQSQQCVNPAQHTHVEIYYAHFSGQPDNYSQHVADIQQMFRDVDVNYLNYDASTYFGVGAHLYVECDGALNPVVHDLALTTPLGNSNFSTLISDMSRYGHNSNLAHYWIWTDGNPEAAFGYAGQSTISQDESPQASNQINSTYQYSINYGYTDANNGAQVFAHENGHAMGAVQYNAPHSTQSWHCTDGYDVMCYNDHGPRGSSYTSSACTPAPNGTLLFDCHFDDYFHPGAPSGSYLASHWNLASANDHWLLLQPAPSVTSIAASDTSPVFSEPVTLTATVSPAGTPYPGTPAGTATFFDGGAALGSAVLSSSGIATYVTSSLGLGSHALSASYAGAGLYARSSSTPVGLTVGQAASATTVSTSANPSALGSNITINAAVRPVAPATGTPTGTVAFFDAGNQIGTSSLNASGVGSMVMSPSYGSHQLYASYSGDADFTPSDNSGAQLVQAVLYPAVTSVTSSAPANTAEYGTQLTFTATVSAGPATPGGQAPPTGWVTFEDGSTPLGPAVAVSGAQATYSASSLAPGTHTIRAVYSGDQSFVPATGALSENVTPFAGFYQMDSYGGIHPVSSPQLPDQPAQWPGWNIARGIVMRSDAHSGYTLDGWGGLHPFGGAPNLAVSGYWPGWDIARGLVLRPDGQSGWVLDGFGALHPFGGAPSVVVTGYWRGWDIASGLVLRPDGESGYVLDGFGGLHPFGVAGDVPAVPHVSGYWRGWNIARGVTLDSDGLGGYVLDGFGGLHPFDNAPPVAVGAYWRGWDIARGVTSLPGPLHMGYVLDGWGALHAFGGAPNVTVPRSGYFPGQDIARAIALS